MDNSKSLAELSSEIIKRCTLSKDEISLIDRVYLKDESLDFLKEFFNKNYDGRALPVIFEKFIIIIKDINGACMRLLVVFDGQTNSFVISFLTDSLDSSGMMILENKKRQKVKGGFNFEVLSCFDTIIEDNILEQFLKYSVDIVSYVNLFLCINRDVVITKEITRKLPLKEHVTVHKQKKNKRKNSNYVVSPNRSTVVVPGKRYAYTIDNITPEMRTRLERHYYVDEWYTRGYHYINKNGKDVFVPGHYKKRHKPNDGLKPQGKNFIIDTNY